MAPNQIEPGFNCSLIHPSFYIGTIKHFFPSNYPVPVPPKPTWLMMAECFDHLDHVDFLRDGNYEGPDYFKPCTNETGVSIDQYINKRLEPFESMGCHKSANFFL